MSFRPKSLYRPCTVLRKVRQGVLLERSRLRKLLAESCAQAVLDDLAQEIAQ